MGGVKLLDSEQSQTFIFPTTASICSVGTISMASQGQPSKNAPSGPLLVHFLHPMQRKGSTSIWPNGGCSSSGTQNMQSNTGQYGTQAGEPAQPVQHSVMTAISFGFFFRGVSIPSDFGSHFSSVAMVSSGSIHPPWATSSLFFRLAVQRS